MVAVSGYIICRSTIVTVVVSFLVGSYNFDNAGGSFNGSYGGGGGSMNGMNGMNNGGVCGRSWLNF